MTMFFDRQGNPLAGVVEWAKLYEDPENRIVALDCDTPITKMVSTIWQGFSAMGNGTDLFETAYLQEGVIQEQVRTATEEQALAEHDRWCHIVFDRGAQPEDGNRDIAIRRAHEQAG